MKTHVEIFFFRDGHTRNFEVPSDHPRCTEETTDYFYSFLPTCGGCGALECRWTISLAECDSCNRLKAADQLAAEETLPVAETLDVITPRSPTFHVNWFDYRPEWRPRSWIVPLQDGLKADCTIARPDHIPLTIEQLREARSEFKRKFSKWRRRKIADSFNRSLEPTDDKRVYVIDLEDASPYGDLFQRVGRIEIPADEICSICKLPFHSAEPEKVCEHPVRLHGNHFFCRAGIEATFKAFGASCPLCRKEFRVIIWSANSQLARQALRIVRCLPWPSHPRREVGWMRILLTFVVFPVVYYWMEFVNCEERCILSWWKNVRNMLEGLPFLLCAPLVWLYLIFESIWRVRGRTLKARSWPRIRTSNFGQQYW